MSNDIRNWFKVDKTISKSIYSKTENEIITSPDTSHIIEDITIEEEIIPNKMRKLKVYTDGSALENGKKGSCCGGIGVFFADNDERNIHKEVYRQGVTNNQCELLAIYEAIIAIKNTEDISRIHIEICSDSEYSIKVITKWAPQWKKNGWTKKGGDIKNLKLIQHIMNEISELRYNFKHVKAHKTCNFPKHTEQYKDWYGNYMADLYANQSAKNLKKRIH
jgi:ribonuclease HI